MTTNRKPQSALRRRLLSITAAIFVVAGVAVVSFLPVQDKYLLHTKGKYHSWGHLFVFIVIAFLAAQTVRSRNARLLVVLGSFLLGFGLELGEHLIYGSGLEWKDILVDAFGVCIGTLLALATETPEPTEATQS